MERSLVSAEQVAREAANCFLLVCACCRWPASESRDKAVRRRALSITDWGRFLRIARRHRVVALVQHALASARVELPDRIARVLAEDARQTARQGLALAAETVRLQSLLDQAQIPNVVLKGSPLARLAYGSISLKHSRDIDLLVPPERAAAALDLLEREGYAIRSPAERLSEAQHLAVVRFGKDIELVHHRTNLHAELHWRATYNPYLPEGVDAKSPTQDVVVTGDLGVRTLAAEEHFAYLCVHGALHAWWRLKWLADLNALLAAGSEEETARLFRHAQQRGVGLCAGQALLLCHRLLELKLPDGLHAELESSRRLDRLVAIALDCMVGADPERDLFDRRFAATGILLLPFLLGRGWRYFAAQCRVASISLGDVVRYPLPPSLHFLYPILRLPFWLFRQARQMGGAVRIAFRT